MTPDDNLLDKAADVAIMEGVEPCEEHYDCIIWEDKHYTGSEGAERFNIDFTKHLNKKYHSKL